MSQNEDTIDLKRVFISFVRFTKRKQKLFLVAFISFLLLGFLVRLTQPKKQKDLYEINYLYESSVLPKESILSILESISKNKGQIANKSISQVKKIDVKVSYSLIELSIQSNTIHSIETCKNQLENQLSENYFIKNRLDNLKLLLEKVILSIDEIEKVKLASTETSNTIIEKLFYQNQSKSLIELYREKQKIEASLSSKTGLQLVNKSTPILIQKYSVVKESMIIFMYGIVGLVLIFSFSLLQLLLRKIYQIDYQ